VSLTRFGTDMCGAMAEYGGKYLKRKTKHGVRSNMSIKDDASEWMPAATGGVEQDD
ncbi:DNA primase, partial [Yersinia enterocolitica]|nr:DNA primase [Yersinia enterocolitica]